MTNINTAPNNNEATNINEDGPYFYALSKGEGKRVAQRFERLFSHNGVNAHPQFVAFSNIPKYAASIEALLNASRDPVLDRTNLTRSQIVMAYNKANRSIILIAKFINLHGLQALLDNMNAAGIGATQPVMDTRHAILRSCSNA